MRGKANVLGREFSEVAFTNFTELCVFYISSPESNLKVLRCRFDSVATSSITIPVKVFGYNTAIAD